MIWSRTGGRDDGPLLVLLHGLGATAEVYADVLALLPSSWPGGWLVLDLPGHGRSSWDAPYSFRRHADAVLSVLPASREAVVVGHSMGGVVALELANDPRVTGVVAFGVKVSWPPSDVEAAQRVAGRPILFFETRDEAVQRYLRLAGLSELVSPAGVDAGVLETGEGWRVARPWFVASLPSRRASQRPRTSRSPGSRAGSPAGKELIAQSERFHWGTGVSSSVCGTKRERCTSL